MAAIKGWIKTVKAGDPVPGGEHLRLECFNYMLHMRIDRDAIAYVIDALSEAYLPGIFGKAVIDVAQDSVPFKIDALATKDAKYRDYVIGYAATTEWLEIPRHGSQRPRNGVRPKNQQHAAVWWRLTRTRSRNTRLTLSLHFRVVHRGDLDQAVALKLCRRYPPPPPPSGGFRAAGAITPPVSEMVDHSVEVSAPEDFEMDDEELVDPFDGLDEDKVVGIVEGDL